MNRMFFGDTFTEIERYLFPVDLYKLSLLCKSYNKMINKNVIENSMVTEIKHRMRLNLGDNHDEFIELLKPMEPVIVGSFITQCVLREKWQGCHIKICISKPTADLQNFINPFGHIGILPNNDPFLKFLFAKKYKTKCGYFANHGYGDVITANVMRCSIYNNKIDILIPTTDVRSFISLHDPNDIYKNMYNITSGELIIHRIDDIFSKRTNLVEYLNFHASYPNIQKRGFKFYRPDQNAKILLTNDGIIQHYESLDIIKVECVDNTYEKHLDTRYEFVIDGNKIYHMIRFIKYSDSPVFTISQMLPNDDKNVNICCHLRMGRCTSDECVVKLIYPESRHYHCTYVTDENKRDVQCDDAFLILN
jgi:hypothetical protein